jgi:hypothetical protein
VKHRPSARQVAERALILYALVRRAAIEMVVAQEHDSHRFAQAETARVETDRWLERESLTDGLTATERMLLGAPSASWTPDAITDGLWRKEALGVLLWALRRVVALPAIDVEFQVEDLNAAIEEAGSVAAFRAQARLRDPGEIEAAWREADTWFGVTEGSEGDDHTLASISAERSRALAWLRDASAREA